MVSCAPVARTISGGHSGGNQTVQLGLGTKTAFGIGQIAEGAKNGAFNIFLRF